MSWSWRKMENIYPNWDSVELLDDWTDDPAVDGSSSGDQITDRDDFSSTEYQGKGSSEFNPDGSRPTYTVQAGGDLVNIDTTNERLELETTGILTDWTFGSDEADRTMRWRFRGDTSGDTDGGSAWTVCCFTLFCNSTSVASRSFDEGYYIYYQANGVVRMGVAEGGSESGMISDDDGVANSQDVHDFEVTRDPDGNWEVFIDGTSIGTATDTTFTSGQYAGFIDRVGDNRGTARFEWAEVY